MSYNFKNLADVELLSSMPEDASVVVEVNGTTKRAPQVDEMAKLAGVETLTEVPEGATVLAEVDGAIKRVPGAGLGSGIKTAIIKDSNYDNALTGTAVAKTDSEVTYSCINMTYEEACEIFLKGEPLNVVLMTATEGLVTISGLVGFMPGLGIIAIFEFISLRLYWTSSGITAEDPGLN